MDTTQIRADMVAAMKAKDQVRTDTLRSVLTAFTNELVAKGRKPTDSLSDDESLAVIKRLAKQRREAAESFQNGGRVELAEKERVELAILESYLPQSMPREEIVRIAKEVIASFGEVDASAAGKLTGAVMKACGGKADGNDVRSVINELLA